MKYEFCPRCGSRLSTAELDGVERGRCDSDGCGFVHWDNPVPVAAVLLEPVVGNMGLVVPPLEFLEAARRLTHRHGALLVFDEVMTGFRLAYGGAQERLGVTLAAARGASPRACGTRSTSATRRMPPAPPLR